MIDGRVSATACIVAAARALCERDDLIPAFSDPWVERLLPRSYIAALDRRALRVLRASAALFGYRTLAIDEGIDEARTPEHQLVLLGAGLDARAWRLESSEALDVFEVDHPSTQSYKRRKTEALPPRPRLRWVAVDFTRDSLAQKLREAGFDDDRPTVWVWEGVTMYLSEADIRQTLSVIEELSAAGSRLLATYIRPGAPRSLVGAGTALLGEPLGSAFRPAELAALLAEYGFDVRRDESSREWRRRWPARRWLPNLFASVERLVTADAR